jgi:hypothetical protein
LQKGGRDINRGAGEVDLGIGGSRGGVYRAAREIYNLLGY